MKNHNKIIFAIIIAILVLVLDGCGVGYARASYNGQSFNGIKGNLAFISMVDKKNKSRLTTTIDITAYNAEQSTAAGKTDTLMTSMIGLDYHKALTDDLMFGVYGELGFGNATYSPYSSTGTALATVKGSGLVYGGGVETMAGLFRLGFRVTPLGSSNMSEILLEYRPESDLFLMD